MNSENSKPLQNPAGYLFLIVAAVIVACGVLYSPALHFDYVWDDATMVFQRADFLRPDWLQYLLTEPFFVSPNYYRPLATLALYADFRFGGANPAISHTINIIIFLFNLTLLSTLLKAVAGKLGMEGRETVTTCTVAILFYAFHCSMIETVVWISGRFDLLLVTFTLCALLCDTLAKTTAMRTIGVACFFLLAAFCKEMAAIFLPILVIWHWLLAQATSTESESVSLKRYLSGASFRNNLKIYTAVFVAGIVYLGIRYSALGYLLVPSHNDYGATTNQAAAILKAIFLYTRILFLPFLTPSITYPQEYPVSSSDPIAFFGLALLLLVIAFQFLQRRPGIGIFATAMLLFLASLLPIIHILPMGIGDNIVNERFLTLPLTIFSISLVPLMHRILPLLRIAFRKGLALLFLCYLLITITAVHAIVPLWRNDITLWSWAYRTHGSDMTALNFANALFNRGHFKEAYEVAASVKQETVMSILRKGEAAHAMNRYEEAQELYWKVLEMPNLPPANKQVLYANIAYMKIMTGDFDGVETLLEKSLASSPAAPRTHFYYAIYYYKQKNFAEAQRYLDNAIHYSAGEPDFQSSYRAFREQFIRAEKEYRETGILPPVFSDEPQVR